MTRRCSRRTASSRACARQPRGPGAHRRLHGRTVGRRGCRQGRPPPGAAPGRGRCVGRGHRCEPGRGRRGPGRVPGRARRSPTPRRWSPAISTSTRPARSAGRSPTTSSEQLTARIVCGGANNQLAHEGIEKLLQDRGVLYAPDYMVNAGGLIQVADELEGFSFERAQAARREDLRHDDRGLRARGGRGRPAGRCGGPARRASDERGRPAARHLARLTADVIHLRHPRVAIATGSDDVVQRGEGGSVRAAGLGVVRPVLGLVGVPSTGSTVSLDL